jgi:hypothetical protein
MHIERKELQRTISNSFLLNKVAVNNAVQQRVAEMQEKIEHKDELEKQRYDPLSLPFEIYYLYFLLLLF